MRDSSSKYNSIKLFCSSLQKKKRRCLYNNHWLLSFPILSSCCGDLSHSLLRNRKVGNYRVRLACYVDYAFTGVARGGAPPPIAMSAIINLCRFVSIGKIPLTLIPSDEQVGMRAHFKCSIATTINGGGFCKNFGCCEKHYLD